MKFTRFLLTAAAAAGVTYWLKGGGPAGRSRQRLALGGGLDGVAPVTSPVAETMWTPADPASAASSALDAPARPTPG